MPKGKPKKVTVQNSSPYAVEMQDQQEDRILGGGSGGGNSVEDALEGMAVFPPHDEHKVVSISRYEGVCYVARLDQKTRRGGDGEKASATLTVWAPNEEDARELLQRTVRAHFAGPGWWDFKHPNYRRHAGTGRDEEPSGFNR